MAVPSHVVVFTSDRVIEDKESLRQLISNFARGVWKDFKTTNKHTAGKAAKIAAGVAAGATVAKHFEVLTPLQWALRGFGPLPAEFTKSGAIQVFEYTTVRRALMVGGAAVAKFALVTVAYEGGVLAFIAPVTRISFSLRSKRTLVLLRTHHSELKTQELRSPISQGADIKGAALV